MNFDGLVLNGDHLVHMMEHFAGPPGVTTSLAESGVQQIFRMSMLRLAPAEAQSREGL
ncbi:hypothetical protein K449DRAFT_466271 [Hypoxylon sp. EC38]|nr:hypothetical protein K449DRAFT_466271 [Hypoxylon sp. EC38]